MANTNGGTIYIGVASDPKVAPAGVREPEKATKRLNNAIQERFSPVPKSPSTGFVLREKHITRCRRIGR